LKLTTKNNSFKDGIIFIFRAKHHPIHTPTKICPKHGGRLSRRVFCFRFFKPVLISLKFIKGEYVALHYRFDKEDWERSCSKESHNAKRNAHRSNICSIVTTMTADKFALSLARSVFSQFFFFKFCLAFWNLEFQNRRTTLFFTLQLQLRNAFECRPKKLILVAIICGL